jgi:hypothetical protein
MSQKHRELLKELLKKLTEQLSHMRECASKTEGDTLSRPVCVCVRERESEIGHLIHKDSSLASISSS